jgi:tetratricopeptide (TPR) repeat protein
MFCPRVLLVSTVATALLGAVACAARPAPRFAVDPFGPADGLVREGCYECLIDARDAYEQLASGRSRQAALVRLFAVHLLIVLREKELAIHSATAAERAGTLAAQLDPRLEAGRYIDIVDAIPADPVGTPKVERELAAPMVPGGLPIRSNPLEQVTRAALATVTTGALGPALTGYLTLTLQCTYRWLSADAPVASAPAAGAATFPLLTYRRAICDNPIDGSALEQVRASVPRFTETALFLGRAAIGALPGTDGGRARAHLQEAYAKFPQSPAVTFHLATVSQASGDCRTATTFFAETLALRERHEDARLGRVVCRTYLAESDAANADATVLIEAGAYNRGEAYYWRAWNRRRSSQLDLARADIDSARSLMYNSRVLTLAGMIEYDQDEIETATADFVKAKELDAQNCAARWYLGIVKFKAERWLEGGAEFADTEKCYSAAAAENERLRDAMAARTDVAEDFRARQIAGFETAIAEDRSQESAAALNAAINYARGGDRETAARYIELAKKDPARRPAAEDLRQVMAAPIN